MNQTRSRNFILHAKSPQFYWEGTGQLSIKTFSNGKAYYKTNRGFFAVENDRYLLLNKGAYTINIDQAVSVESFCIFFKDDFANNIFQALKKSNNQLLTDPFKNADSIEFIDKTYLKNDKLSSLLNIFKQNLPFLDKNTIGYEEYFHQIMQVILNEHFKVNKEIELLHAVRRSTREELYRRICIAHDYIRSCFAKQIKLDDIAKISCLSPNHLLRSYTQIYGKTPHQHITYFRINKAKELLRDERNTMTDITFEIGLQNPVSFSKLFKQYVGISPQEFRKKVILDKKHLQY
ncbi:helix-turn-helix domain-containing protein [Oceanobacillus neutriphilus]|uniref:HTH araC/xylS-type domain-containing protein n=1 Tax=Oceanobacillus neutriphilus TaxID=531815 RepID=A0ABQ2NZR8_9BACI|nr:helix-turn-helix domain-containing protein [Oceanobacillus neutriphilus]GGP14618.1 hypothetical protein GCM10011346_39290 [Oceanobacillus neutriphilus]